MPVCLGGARWAGGMVSTRALKREREKAQACTSASCLVDPPHLLWGLVSSRQSRGGSRGLSASSSLSTGLSVSGPVPFANVPPLKELLPLRSGTPVVFGVLLPYVCNQNEGTVEEEWGSEWREENMEGCSEPS